MAEPKSPGRESGIRSAIAMLRQLERDDALTASCDPAADEFAEPLPLRRNIVLEYLDSFGVSSSAVEAPGISPSRIDSVSTFTP